MLPADGVSVFASSASENLTPFFGDDAFALLLPLVLLLLLTLPDASTVIDTAVTESLLLLLLEVGLFVLELLFVVGCCVLDGLEASDAVGLPLDTSFLLEESLLDSALAEDVMQPMREVELALR